MNIRLKKIRKTQNMTMEKFGKELGVTKTTISRLEKGERNLTNQMIKAVCQKFNVNETWLRYGEGSPYNIPEDKTAAIVSDLLKESNPMYDLIISIVKTYQSLDSKSQDVLDSFIKDVANNMERPPQTNSLYDGIPATAEEFEKKYPPIDFNNKNSKTG